MSVKGSLTGSANFRNIKRVRTFVVFSGIIVLAYGIVLAAFSNSGFPVAMKTGSSFPYLCDKPVGEDAYYMLSVARNIARGRGIVYNGQKKTAGIQPLVTFIYAGFIWIAQKSGGDEWALVRLILIFGIITHLLLAHVIGRISRHLAGDDLSDRAGAYALGFCLALLNFTLFRLSTYGLETPIYLLILSLSVLMTFGISGGPRFPWRKAVSLGGLFGVAALARVDFLVIAAVFLSIALFRRKINLWQAALIGGIALLLVSPWFFWVKSTSGSWVPSSGQAQSIFMSSRSLLTRLGAMGLSLADHMTPWAFEASRGFLIILGAASCVGAVVWLWRNNREDMNARLFSSLKKYPFCLEWAASLTVLVLIYAFFFWAMHFYSRYSAPVLILYLPVLANQVQKRLEKSRGWIELGLIAGMLVSFSATAFMSFHAGAVGNSLTINAGFVQEKFPKSLRIGAFQSGVLGFFHENVSNLDGKIDASVLRHLQSRSMARFLDEEKIEVLIDWPSYIYSKIDSEYLENQWAIYPEKVPENLSVCLVRKSPR
jgi:hypothetical protein